MPVRFRAVLVNGSMCRVLGCGCHADRNGLCWSHHANPTVRALWLAHQGDKVNGK